MAEQALKVLQSKVAGLERSGKDAVLKNGYIDLNTIARVASNVPIEYPVGALADFTKKGGVRYIGLSEASAASIRNASEVHPIMALQTEYSLWTRIIES